MIKTINNYITQNFSLSEDAKMNNLQLLKITEFINIHFPQFSNDDAKQLITKYSLLYHIIENSEYVKSNINEESLIKYDSILFCFISVYMELNNLEYQAAEEKTCVNICSEYLKNISRLKVTESDEVLFERLQKNEPYAKELLVQKYLYFVYNYIFSQHKRIIKSEFDLMDLLQAANMALLNAIDGFDYAKNVKFITYLCVAINRHLIRELNVTQNTIKRNLDVEKEIKFLELQKERFYLINGYMPNDEELAIFSGISLKRLKKLEAWNLETLSLESDFDGGLEIEDINSLVSDDVFEENKLGSIWEIIDNVELTDSERLVIELIYKNNFQYKQIVPLLGVTKSRVGQIHNTALRKMRENYRIQRLRKNN